MKKTRKQLEAERIAEEQERSARKERRRRAREALEQEEAAAQAQLASTPQPSRPEAFFEEDQQGMEEVKLEDSAIITAQAPLYSGAFLRKFTCVACLGLAITCSTAIGWRRNTPLPTFKLGSSTLVAMKSVAQGKYLQLSTQDGLLRASAASSSDLGAVFRVLVLSSGTVRALRLAAQSRERFSEAHEHKGRTKSGCRCSGFSNEHGFGRFCHPWESATQVMSLLSTARWHPRLTFRPPPALAPGAVVLRRRGVHERARRRLLRPAARGV